MKINDSELKILAVLWENGSMKASDIARVMTEKTGWNKNTTYTVIKRCIEKSLISRTEPDYICTAAITKRKAANREISELLNTYFDGSVVRFFLTLLDSRPISRDDAKELKRIIKTRSFKDF